MKNLHICILENVAFYGKRLADYISSHAGSPFVVQLCLRHPSGEKMVKEADVVVVSSSLWPLYQTMAESGKWLILDEDGKSDIGECPVLYKFQSAEVIYKAMLQISMDTSNKLVRGNGLKKQEFEWLVLYTPVRDAEATEQVMQFCRQKTRKRKVLYLNMESVSSMRGTRDENGRQESLSDLIYYIKQGRKNVGARLEMMVQKEMFDYLLPVNTPAEIRELTDEEWHACYGYIQQDTDYESVIVDFGASVPERAVLNMCDEIRILADDTDYARELVLKYKQLLMLLSDRDVAGLIQGGHLDETVSGN